MIFRPLGATERLFYKMRDCGGMNAVAFAHGVQSNSSEKKSAFNELRMTVALRELQRENGLLQATIKTENGIPVFCPLKMPTLPVCFLMLENETQFPTHIEQAYKHNFTDNQCLWKIVCIQYHHNSAKFSLLLCFDHTIADGTSLCYFIDALLQRYQRLQESSSQHFQDQARATDIDASLEDIVNHKLSAKDIFIFAASELLKLISPSLQPAFIRRANYKHRMTKSIYFTLTNTVTEKLIHAAKEKGITLNSVIVAAMLFCSYKAKREETHNGINTKKQHRQRLSTANNVSFRRNHNISNTQLGVYISAVTNRFTLDDGCDFWCLANAAKRAISHEIDKNMPIVSAHAFEWLQRTAPDKTRIDLLNNKRQGRLETLCISNIGKLDIAGKSGDLELTDMGFGAGQHGFGHGYTLSLLTFNDQLRFNFQYVDPLLSRDRAESFCKDFIALLESSTNTSSLTLAEFISNSSIPPTSQK